MYQNLRQAGAATSEQSQLPTGLQVGLGVRAAATTRNFSQGTLQQTGNNLDVAIKGQGFFQIQLPDGTTGYTRDGGFQVDANGQLVTNAGYAGAARHHDPGQRHRRVTIAADGTVSVTLPGQAAPQAVGQIAAGQLHQPGRPGAARRQPLRRDRRLGHAERRRAQRQRPGLAAAGLRRRQQRQRGRGAGVA